MVINTYCGTLQGIDPLLILLRKLCQIRIHRILKLLLHIQVNRGINAIALGVQILFTVIIGYLIICFISLLFLFTCKLCFEFKAFLFHDCPDRTVIGISLYVVILRFFRPIQHNLFRYCLFIGLLPYLAIL